MRIVSYVCTIERGCNEGRWGGGGQDVKLSSARVYIESISLLPGCNTQPDGMDGMDMGMVVENSLGPDSRIEDEGVTHASLAFEHEI